MSEWRHIVKLGFDYFVLEDFEDMENLLDISSRAVKVNSNGIHRPSNAVQLAEDQEPMIPEVLLRKVYYPATELAEIEVAEPPEFFDEIPPADWREGELSEEVPSDA